MQSSDNEVAVIQKQGGRERLESTIGEEHDMAT